MKRPIFIIFFITIFILGCVAKKEIVKIDAPLGLKWYMSAQEMQDYAQKNGYKFKISKREEKDPPNYIFASLKGYYKRSGFYVPCSFWNDSLYYLVVYSNDAKLTQNTKIMKKIVNRSVRYHLIKNIQADTEMAWVEILSQCVASDSSIVTYSTSKPVERHKMGYDGQNQKMLFKASNYSKIEFLVNNDRLQWDTRFYRK
jgi:hypothetical protein